MIELLTLGTVDVRIAGERAPALHQPKRLALLAWLALAAPSGTHRRDVLLAHFWPESEPEAARRALRQAVHYLRKVLGAETLVSRGDQIVALDRERLWCDALAFEQHLAGGRRREAIALYRGDFLPGLFVQGAPEVEEWIESTRARLRALARDAITMECEQADPASAVQWARRLVALEPGSEPALRMLLRAHLGNGDPAAARAAFDHHARRLQGEGGLSPAPETLALVAGIPCPASPRGSAPAPRRAGVAAHLPSVAAPAESPGAHPPRRPAPLARRRGLVAAAFALGAGMFALALVLWRGSAGYTPYELGQKVHTRSPAAARLYVQGIRAFYAGDPRGAARLLDAALREDSTLAMAALYRHRVADDIASDHAFLERARRLSQQQGNDEERLLIAAEHAAAFDDSSFRAYAETLAIRYPRNPDGALMLARARIGAADFLGAIGPARQAIEADAAALKGQALRCRACEAYGELLGAYSYADSQPALDRVSLEWLRLQPRAPGPWAVRAGILASSGRYDEALAAIRTKSQLERNAEGDTPSTIEILLRAGDFAAADLIARDWARRAPRDGQVHANWLLSLSYRMQGRHAEALEAARRVRALDRPQVPASTSTLLQAGPEAQALLDMGQPRAAAALFDSIAHEPFTPGSPSREGRHRAGQHTRMAQALAALHDTAALAAMAETVRVEGARSGYARDQRLHHHVRGLLLRERGDLEGAVREFRLAFYSPMGGWGPVNLELGRTLLALGKYREAAAVLDAGIRGPLGASGYRVDRTEMHRLMARALDAMHQADSARAHLAWVDRATRRVPAGAARDRAVSDPGPGELTGRY